MTGERTSEQRLRSLSISGALGIQANRDACLAGADALAQIAAAQAAQRTLADENARLRERLDRALALLRKIEWEGIEIHDDEGHANSCCPACHAVALPHTPDCELARLLK